MAKQTTYTSKYSLADYIVTIEFPGVTTLTSTLPAENLSIGGSGNVNEGSCVGEISVSRANNLFETESDVTGSWVHNRNLAKNGTVTINIRQVSDHIIKLMKYCNAYESVQALAEGLTINIEPATPGQGTSNFIVCYDCYIQKIPDQTYAATAAMQPWVFTCGQIIYSPK